MASEVGPHGPHVTPWDLGLGLGKLWSWGSLSSAIQPRLSTPSPSFPGTPFFPSFSPLSANIFPFMFLFLLFPPLTLWSCTQEKFSSQSIMSYSECQPHVLSQALVLSASSLPVAFCVWRGGRGGWEERPQSAQEPWETAHKK